MKSITALFTDTIQFFYPHICTGCGSDILQNDQLLCAKCISSLPYTRFELYPGNPVEKIFWGRISLAAAHSQFYFSKGSLIQQLIHELKYKGNTGIGFYLGELIGKNLLQSNRFKSLDYLIPLPLYPDKERKRGYNQAAVISNGISSVINVPVNTGNVIRLRSTETQTKKHRDQRWENVEGSFIVKNERSLEGKNLLLVDDVVTTGASLEACGNVILKITGVQLSIATLAHASK